MPHAEMIKDRLRFLEISDGDVDELGNVKQILEPELDRMLDEFYSHVTDEPRCKRVFADDKSMERARASQKQHWLQTLFGGRFTASYFDKVDRIGRTHARVGLTTNWYIGGYCKMLIQFIQQVSAAAAKEGRDPSPIIESLCKAILLDLDLVIHCYLEAKDKAMVELLKRSTSLADDLTRLNSELSLATAQARETTEAMSKEVTGNDRHAGQLAKLSVEIEALTDKVKQMDERVRQIKKGDRLYLQKGSDETGTFARLKALILGE